MKPWKLQRFASDVVYDLRTRNMLSIAIVLVVGILAVPFLIKASGTESDSSSAGLTAGDPAELPPEAQAAVLAYNPGVRNYKRRLDQLSAKNPFTQQFTDSAGAGGGSDVAAAVETITDGGGGTMGTEPSPDGGDGGAGSTVKVKTKTRYFYYETDVRAGESGTELTLHRNVDQFEFLPDAGVPVVVFLGVSGGGKQAIFLVSKDVSGVSGEGTCFPDPANCQLLGLDTDGGADLIYSPAGKSYRVEVAEIDRKVSSKPPN